MTVHNNKYRSGFAPGLTWITRYQNDDDIGIGLGVLKLAAGDLYALTTEKETALLLMSGRVDISFDGQSASVARDSLFDQAATCLHVCGGINVQLRCLSEAEFTLYQTANAGLFTARLHRPETVACEQRGKGQVGDTCWREVRTIFGLEENRGNANLVLGEVITFPGRWSSYPPHHHLQPEIYHYRFTEPQGYGHAELGEEVFRVQQYDTVTIHDLKDHAQCAAPGYGMYYSWVIRHLPGDPYIAPEFTPEHSWVMQPNAAYWQPEKNKSRG